MFAVRNNRMCTKDCLCIHVCPTGATDTEDGQIDHTKCIGCGVCALACPAAAISMAQEKARIPEQQPNEKPVVETLAVLAASKAEQEAIARQLAAENIDPVFTPLAEALARSNRIMAEGLLAEAGFMVPEDRNTQIFLQSLLIDPPSDFPVDTVQSLLAAFAEGEQ